LQANRQETIARTAKELTGGRVLLAVSGSIIDWQAIAVARLAARATLPFYCQPA
jgi:hypothetical protein